MLTEAREARSRTGAYSKSDYWFPTTGVFFGLGAYVALEVGLLFTTACSPSYMRLVMDNWHYKSTRLIREKFLKSV